MQATPQRRSAGRLRLLRSHQRRIRRCRDVIGFTQYSEACCYIDHRSSCICYRGRNDLADRFPKTFAALEKSGARDNLQFSYGT
jgi:hypothetical protein